MPLQKTYVLTRPVAYDNAFEKLDLPIEKISNKFYNMGLNKEFDEVLIKNALKVAKKFPITLNASPNSLLDNEFLDNIADIISLYPAEDIIFEILEHDIPKKVDISRLREMNKLGYRFVLDDHTVLSDDAGKLIHDPKHQRLLDAFDEIICGIKIDGPLVCAGLGDEKNEKQGIIHHRDNFHLLVDDIKTQRPDDYIIAERVYNRKEADLLHNSGIHYVQGRYLEYDDFAHLNRNWKENDGGILIPHNHA